MLGRLAFLVALGAVAATLVSSDASAQDTDRALHSGWLRSSYLTGDWGGRRARLNERGIVPFARYTSGFWSNLRGGFETGTRYEGFAQWGIDLDLELLAGWKGARFYIDWYSYHGGQPSTDLVGSFPTTTVSGWETSNVVRFYEIFLQQEWMEGRWLLKAGQLASDDDFFVVSNDDALLNGTFGFFGLGRTQGIFPFYPLAAPGVHLQLSGSEKKWVGQVGVYTSDPGGDTSGNHGFGWTFDEGVSVLGEIQTIRSVSGRRGKYGVGAALTTDEVPNFETGGSSYGGYGLYALIDQDLTVASASRPSLGVFLRSYGAPQPERQFTLWYLDLGLKLGGFLAGRSEDVVTLGFAHLAFSPDYVDSLRADVVVVSRRQSVLEAAYRAQITGWLTLQPDLQVFFDPHFSRRDAIVIGLRAVMDL